MDQITQPFSSQHTNLGVRGFTDPSSVWLPWLAKGSVAVVDQTLFSGTNFLVNVLLARWFIPADYGAFAWAFSVLLLLGSFHTALLTEPMLVFGAGKYKEQYQLYLGLMLYGHFALTSAGAVMLFIVGGVIAHFYSTLLGHTLFGAAFAAPAMLLLWLARRACYVKLRPAWSATGGLFYLILLLPGIHWLHNHGFLNPVTSLVAMAIVSLVISGFLLIVLQPRWSRPSGHFNLRTVVDSHWQYGRWSTAAVVVSWIPTNIYFIILPAFLGLGTVGALRAVLNIPMPALQTVAAFSLILLPTLSGERRRAGVMGINSTIKLHFTVLAIGALGYLTLMWAARSLVFPLLYGNKYSEYASTALFIACLLPLTEVATTTVANGLRALERPDFVFWCYFASAIVAVLLGIPLATGYGVPGALLGQLLSALTASVALIIAYRSGTAVKSSPEAIPTATSQL